MKILVLTPDYPDDRRSTFPFVKQLVDELANQGHDIQVLAPYSLSHNKRFYKRLEKFEKEKGSITIYRPYYLSFSKFKFGKTTLSNITARNAFRRGLKMLEIKPDIIYGHFWNSAYNGFEYAKTNNIPLFVATGESEILKLFKIPTDVGKFADYISGVVCVSSKNREESISLGLTSLDKCTVVPNAVNHELFFKRDKKEVREQLGIPHDVFIVAFVGWFNERKGAKRVAEAIDSISGGGVYSIFIGRGNSAPECPNILFKGALPHALVPLYLNAADCFVLPTLAEGCCNAVVEAMACGLPIVSSNLDFNWDVLDSTNSILINPTNIEDIANAIKTLRDDKKMLMRLGEGALNKARGLTIKKRAELIIQFIKEAVAVK